MKILKYNFKSLIICLSAIGFISIFLISCQDDDKLSNQMNHKTMFQGYSDSQIEDELIKFLDNLETIRKDPKDALADEVMELEPILWYMEACINYKYGASVQPELVKMDTSYVNFNVSGTTYKLEDVQVSFDNIVDSIAAFFYELEEEEKYFLMVNISVAEQTSQNISLQVISSFSLNGIIPNVNDYDWYWGMNLGQCVTHNGVPLDAADIIMRGANHSILIPAPECYYTDISIHDVFQTYLYQNNNNEPLGFFDYQVGTLNHECLDPEKIAFFRNGLIEIGNLFIPTGKVIAFYFSEDEYSAGLNSSWQDTWSMFHTAKFNYGIRHLRNSSSIDLPNNPNNI